MIFHDLYSLQLDMDSYIDSFAGDDEPKESRKDYCHDCFDDGYWVMMALKCRKCDKILIGG